MRKAPLLLLFAVICPFAARPAFAQAPPVIVAPPSITAYVGQESKFTVSASSSAPGPISINTSPLPAGGILTSTSPTSIEIKWRPTLGQMSTQVCFTAIDSAGHSSLGLVCTNMLVGASQLQWLTGVIRDFKPTHADMNRPINEDTGIAGNFVSPNLGVNGRPVFAGSGSTFVSKFNEWFTDVPTINDKAIESVELSNALQPDPNVYQFSTTDWRPIDGELWNAGVSGPNRFFTWEAHASLTYSAGLQLTFKSSDDLWVFINKKLVPGWSLSGTHALQSFTLNLDFVAASLGLTPGATYPIDIFYAHRGATTTPGLQLQLTNPAVCNAFSVPYTAVNIASGGFNNSNVDQFGTSAIVGGNIRLSSTGSPMGSSGAAWLKTPHYLRSGFELQFGFQITSANTPEGFAVVIGRNTGVGGTTGELGYGGLANTLAIEFDAKTSPEFADPSYQHISVHQNGSANEFTSSIGLQPQIALLPNAFGNASAQTVRIAYTPVDDSGFGWLRVWMNQNLVPALEAWLPDALFTSVVNGGEAGYIGFTSARSGALIGDDVLIKSARLTTIPPLSVISNVFNLPPPVEDWPVGPRTFMFRARTSCNLPRNTGGDAASFQATVSNPQFSAFPPATITDTADGRYVVTYTPPEPGRYTARVLYTNDFSISADIVGSPFMVRYLYDSDLDGVYDDDDNCRFTANSDQANWDGDAPGDACDADDDNDTKLDAIDACPFTPITVPLFISNPATDRDDDGCRDSGEDLDDDNDGVADVNDAFPFNPAEWLDTDHDGIGNNADLDDDNDGQSDADEIASGSDPLNPLSKAPDLDGDGRPDAVDPDDENDGILDAADNCPRVVNADQLNHDGDALGDACDPDDDNDGVADVDDAFPFNPAESVDTDHDGIGNNADPDDDNDGQSDADEIASGSNPLDPSSKAADFDGDGRPDAVDPDDDNDGVADANDAFPRNPAESIDTDHDGIGNNADLDDDGDGQSDADEIASGSNPLDPSSTSPDLDGDGRPDAVDPDDDNDGVADANDACPTEAGSGPNGCEPVTLTFVGPQPPYRPGATYNSKQAVPLKWQYASSNTIVSSASANPIVRLFGTVTCGATTGGSTQPLQTNSGLQYDQVSKTWQFNWKPSLPVGGYYFTITNQQTGETAGPFAMCLGK